MLSHPQSSPLTRCQAGLMRHSTDAAPQADNTSRSTGTQPASSIENHLNCAELENQNLVLDLETTIAALAEAASEHLPTPREHSQHIHSLKTEAVASGYGYQSDWSHSEIEDEVHSTSGTSDTPQLSALDGDEWQHEPEWLLDQVHIAKSDLRRLDDRRLKLIARQLSLRESRRTLQQQRDAISDQQAQLLEEIRIVVLTGGKRDLDYLFDRLHGIRELQEELRSQELHYDRIEKRLIDREWRFRNAEVKLLTGRALTTQKRSSAPGHSPVDGSRKRKSLSSTTSSHNSGTNTILRQGSASRPTLQAVRIRLHELELEHEQLLEEERLRRDLNMNLDEESNYSLRVFPIRKAELLQHLKYYEEGEAERQATLANSFDNSLDQFPAYQFTGHDLEVFAKQKVAGGMSDAVASLEDEILYHEAGEPRPERLLLPETIKHMHESRILPRFADQDETSIPSGLAYIGDWFLDTLQSSSFAIFQFKLNLDPATASLDTRSLQVLFLSFWYRDDTSEWYLASLRRAAESLDPTLISESIFTGLQFRNSNPNLLLLHKRMGRRGQSRSLFARRSEVADLLGKLKDLRISK